MKLTSGFVEKWSKKYPVEYDKEFYDPYIVFARRGNPSALRKLTEWKNVSKAMTPMRLSKRKEISFKFFLSKLHTYLEKNGKENLRGDFKKRAPVFSIFWSHVLFSTPIFDVYTNMAFQYFAKGKCISKKEAKIRAGTHWKIYDEYAKWFFDEEKRLKIKEPRKLDRALFAWGKEQAEKCNYKI